MKRALASLVILAAPLAYADTPPTGGAPNPDSQPAPAEPTPGTTVPTAPAAPTGTPTPPATPPADPAKPVIPVEPEPANGTYSKRTMSDKPAEGASLGHYEDATGPAGSDGSGVAAKKNPTLVAELSGTGAYVANPYVEYKGYTLETGQSKGARLEGNFLGIIFAYEVSSLPNEKACGLQCFSGDYGSTRFHSLEVGYRYRFGMLGPIRPFLTGSVGGVLATQGSWTMTDPGIAKGGVGRFGFGIEVPIMAKFFASATIAYRVIITENPYRSAELETSQAAFVGGDRPNGDYAEDLHLVAGYVGFGMEL